MKNFKCLFPFALNICIWFSSFSQSYERLNPGNTLPVGAQFYYLPKAAFLIEMTGVKKEFKKGARFGDPVYTDIELAVLARKYGVDIGIFKKLQIKEFTERSVSEDSLKVSITSVADDSKLFYRMPQKKTFVNQSDALTYGSDGILTDAETSYENKTFDIIVKGLSGLVSAAAAFKGIAGIDDNKTTIKDLDDILQAYSTLNTQISFDIYKDIKATLEKKYTKVFAEYFYSSKSTAFASKILYCPSTPPPPDGTSILDLFELHPDENKFVYKSTLEPDIMYAKNAIAGNVSKPYKMKLSFLKSKWQPSNQFTSASPALSAFGYNIPAKMIVSIVTPSSEELLQEVYKIPQFGKVGYVIAKKAKLVFQLDPLTGELKKLTITTNAITTDQVGSASDLLVNGIKTIKGDDDDTKLDKEVKRLENEKKKRDLLKELNPDE